MDAKFYTEAVRDERVFNRLKVDVRELAPSEASARVLEVYALNSRVGMRLANACSRDKAVFKKILADGITKADLSTIRQWMKCVVPRIGVVATINEIVSSENCDALLGETCVYWIESMGLGRSTREKNAIFRLKEILGERSKKAGRAQG
jgi:hypothetical protein